MAAIGGVRDRQYEIIQEIQGTFDLGEDSMMSVELKQTTILTIIIIQKYGIDSLKSMPQAEILGYYREEAKALFKVNCFLRNMELHSEQLLGLTDDQRQGLALIFKQIAIISQSRTVDDKKRREHIMGTYRAKGVSKESMEKVMGMNSEELKAVCTELHESTMKMVASIKMKLNRFGRNVISELTTNEMKWMKRQEMYLGELNDDLIKKINEKLTRILDQNSGMLMRNSRQISYHVMFMRVVISAASCFTDDFRAYQEANLGRLIYGSLKFMCEIDRANKGGIASRTERIFNSSVACLGYLDKNGDAFYMTAGMIAWLMVKKRTMKVENIDIYTDIPIVTPNRIGNCLSMMKKGTCGIHQLITLIDGGQALNAIFKAHELEAEFGELSKLENALKMMNFDDNSELSSSKSMNAAFNFFGRLLPGSVSDCDQTIEPLQIAKLLNTDLTLVRLTYVEVTEKTKRDVQVASSKDPSREPGFDKVSKDKKDFEDLKKALCANGFEYARGTPAFKDKRNIVDSTAVAWSAEYLDSAFRKGGVEPVSNVVFTDLNHPSGRYYTKSSTQTLFNKDDEVILNRIGVGLLGGEILKPKDDGSIDTAKLEGLRVKMSTKWPTFDKSASEFEKITGFTNNYQTKTQPASGQEESETEQVEEDDGEEEERVSEEEGEEEDRKDEEEDTGEPFLNFAHEPAGKNTPNAFMVKHGFLPLPQEINMEMDPMRMNDERPWISTAVGNVPFLVDPDTIDTPTHALELLYSLGITVTPDDEKVADLDKTKSRLKFVGLKIKECYEQILRSFASADFGKMVDLGTKNPSIGTFARLLKSIGWGDGFHDCMWAMRIIDTGGAGIDTEVEAVKTFGLGFAKTLKATLRGLFNSAIMPDLGGTGIHCYSPLSLRREFFSMLETLSELEDAKGKLTVGIIKGSTTEQLVRKLFDRFTSKYSKRGTGSSLLNSAYCLSRTGWLTNGVTNASRQFEIGLTDTAVKDSEDDSLLFEFSPFENDIEEGIEGLSAVLTDAISVVAGMGEKAEWSMNGTIKGGYEFNSKPTELQDVEVSQLASDIHLIRKSTNQTTSSTIVHSLLTALNSDVCLGNIIFSKILRPESAPIFLKEFRLKAADGLKDFLEAAELKPGILRPTFMEEFQSLIEIYTTQLGICFKSHENNPKSSTAWFRNIFKEMQKKEPKLPGELSMLSKSSTTQVALPEWTIIMTLLLVVYDLDPMGIKTADKSTSWKSHCDAEIVELKVNDDSGSMYFIKTAETGKSVEDIKKHVMESLDLTKVES